MTEKEMIIIEFYWGDLIPEKQKKTSLLIGENCNCDSVPFCKIEIETEETFDWKEGIYYDNIEIFHKQKERGLIMEKSNEPKQKNNKSFKSKTIKIIIAILIFLFAMQLFKGGEKINQKTPEGTAKILVKALIDGDERALDEINQSTMFENPTQFFFPAYAPQFAGKKLKNYKFKKKKNIYGDECVLVYYKRNKEPTLYLEIEKIGKKYYFMRLASRFDFKM